MEHKSVWQAEGYKFVWEPVVQVYMLAFEEQGCTWVVLVDMLALLALECRLV